MLDWVPSAPYTAEQLLEVLRILRDPENGCPWDKVQTHASIRKNFLEETCEVLEAIDADDPAMLREELGDALFILCKIAQMSGVDPEDALHRACDKYQGRFRRVADAADRPLNAYTEAEKIALWEQAKEN
mgnify:FL=1